jgi:hypothetical protein
MAYLVSHKPSYYFISYKDLVTNVKFFQNIKNVITCSNTFAWAM